MVILDSWDSTAEGTGEKDSRLPSIAISHILDIVHAENGPAVLVLMNTIKDGSHSRCNGIVEDRADAIFEVRDLTGVQFTGQRPWWEEMPVVGAKDWAARAPRRKEKERFRLGFTASKYKLEGPEPAPFAVEVDFTTTPFSICDITDQIDAEGAEARRRKAAEKAEMIHKAINVLRIEIERRSQNREPDILKKQAETFITKHGFTQRIAREALKSPIFKVVSIGGGSSQLRAGGI